MDKLASEYKVLIVDDVPTNVMLVQAILKKEGYTLLTCDSGTKALRIANEKHPNLILLDIMMPEMDGYEVLQHLKSNPETTDIPVIIMSALSDMQSIVKGYQLGATEYVTKPFQREELVKRVAHRYELYSIKRIKAELAQIAECLSVRGFLGSFKAKLAEFAENPICKAALAAGRDFMTARDGRRAEKVLVDGAREKVGEMGELSREMDELSLLDEAGDMRGASRKLDGHEAPARPRDNQVL